MDPTLGTAERKRRHPTAEQLPLELRCTPAGWLDEMREFRARVAWNGGQRPTFRRADGGFHDPDPHDVPAYHLILREPLGGRIVGCVRYAGLEELPASRIREINPRAAAELITAARCADPDVLEGGRLIVDPAWRKHGLASHLLLAGTALARVLDRRLIWGTAGVREGQERVFLRLGYRTADAPPAPAPHLDDDLRIIVCTPTEVPAEIEPLIGRLEPRLRAWLVGVGGEGQG